MQPQPGPRITALRRPLTAVALAITAVAVLPVTAPSEANAASSTPRLTDVVVSASHLGEAGGVVTVSTTTINTTRCRLHVRPAVRLTPPPKRCTGDAVRWRVRLPANPTALVTRYRFTLTAVGHHHDALPRHRAVTVAAASAPPAITSFAASHPQLEFVGGRDNILLSADRGLTCALSVTPAVPHVPAATSCTGPTQKWPLPFPANGSTTAVTYTVGVTVTGTHHRKATASTTVVVAPHPPPCPGQTSTATPRTAAYFNDPTTNQTADQDRVVDAEINLICDAQLPVKGKPTHIALGMFIYQLDGVSQALLWARQYMHASVNVLLDGSNRYTYADDGTVIDNSAYESLSSGLPAGSVLLCGPNAGTVPPPREDGGDDGTAAFPSGTGCAGDNIMHTKLLVVSAIDAAGDPAVFSSSQNLGVRAETAALNNGLQVVGDKTLYRQDTNYFGAIAADKPQPNIGGVLGASPVTAAGATMTNTYFPRNVPAAFPADSKYHHSNDQPTDSIAALLKTVDCANPGAKAGTHSGGTGRTSIRIAISAFTKRPLVISALTTLAAAGCDIGVIYSTMAAKTLTDLTAAGIRPEQLNDSAYPYTDGSGTGLVFVHDKYLLISGGLKTSGGTVTDQDVVVTGSENYTQHCLHRNDESSIAYQQTAGSTPIFDAYASNWDHLAAIVASIPPPAG